MISVDSYHTQKGVYTTNKIPTRTERNAWHHDNVMKMKNQTKVIVKHRIMLMKNPLPIPSTRLPISSDCLRMLTKPIPAQTILNEQTVKYIH